MGLRRCPGSLAFTQPKIETVRCPHCGGGAEIWSDEVEGACQECHRKFMRSHKPSCADWCKYARECLGDETYKKYQNARSTVRKEALLRAVEDRFNWNEERRKRARAILLSAEDILKEQPSADPNIVVAATVLSVQGVEESVTTSPGEPTGEPAGGAFRAILEGLGYPNGFIKQVYEIISPRSPEPASNLNYCIVHDATVLSDNPQGPTAGSGRGDGSQVLLTETACRIAHEGSRAGGGV